MCVFFFQAEDGIRDLVRSRGLGDVYKRQVGSYISIPQSQQTFKPNPGIAGYENLEETATITGSTGNVYLGPQGFISYPHGFDVASLPSGIYQAAGSYYGTELLLRFFPKIKVSDSETGFWGLGLKHSITQWINDPPFDI